MGNWLGDYLVMLFSCKRYSRKYNRYKVETLLVGRVWWDTVAYPVLKVEGQGQGSLQGQM